MNDWKAYLAELNDAVARTRAAVQAPDGPDLRGLDLATPVTPAGPLGQDDAEQALALLRGIEQLSDELSQARDRAGRELMLHRRLSRGRPASAGPAFVDRHG